MHPHDRPTVKIDDIEFKYEQPNVAVDTNARFAEHQVLGDVTVRQKLGEDPDEIEISGVCTLDEANQVDELPRGEEVYFRSHRWRGIVQIDSTSTKPISNGGGFDKDEEWIYRFTISAVEVEEGGFMGGFGGGGGPMVR